MTIEYKKFNPTEIINPGDIISLLPVCKNVIKTSYRFPEEQIIRYM